MSNLLKKLTTTLLAGIIASSLVACGKDITAASQKTKSDTSLPKEINFGILRVPNDETIAIAEGLFDKYFEEKGIKCNFIVFDSGVDANKALASGSIDFATMGNTNGIVAKSLGIDVEMVWIHEVLGEIEGLAVRDGSGIDKIEDLAGKKIVTPFASTSHYSLLNALKQAGIEDKVQLLDMQTTKIVAAWERGDIDAAYTWQPSLGSLLKNGKVILSSEDMAKKGYITANVDLVRKEFADKHPELVSDFIACLTEAANIYRENPEKAAEIVAKELEITPEDALVQMKGSIWHTPEELLQEKYFGTSEKRGKFAEVMKDTSDFLKEQGSIKKSPTQEEFNEYVNPLYIEKYILKGQ